MKCEYEISKVVELSTLGIVMPFLISIAGGSNSQLRISLPIDEHNFRTFFYHCSVKIKLKTKNIQ